MLYICYIYVIYMLYICYIYVIYMLYIYVIYIYVIYIYIYMLYIYMLYIYMLYIYIYMLYIYIHILCTYIYIYIFICTYLCSFWWPRCVSRVEIQRRLRFFRAFWASEIRWYTRFWRVFTTSLSEMVRYGRWHGLKLQRCRAIPGDSTTTTPLGSDRSNDSEQVLKRSPLPMSVRLLAQEFGLGCLNWRVGRVRVWELDGVVDLDLLGYGWRCKLLLKLKAGHPSAR